MRYFFLITNIHIYTKDNHQNQHTRRHYTYSLQKVPHSPPNFIPNLQTGDKVIIPKSNTDPHAFHQFKVKSGTAVTSPAAREGGTLYPHCHVIRRISSLTEPELQPSSGLMPPPCSVSIPFPWVY